MTGKKEKRAWNREKVDNGIFVAGWLVTVLAAVFYWTVRTGVLPLHRYVVPCMFHRLTGLYCPGCGGTRAFFALCRGNFWDAFRYYPLVPCTAVLGGWFLLSQSIEKISRKHIRIGMHFREIYLWLALAAIVLNCVVKNLVLVIWNCDLLMPVCSI